METEKADAKAAEAAAEAAAEEERLGNGGPEPVPLNAFEKADKANAEEAAWKSRAEALVAEEVEKVRAPPTHLALSALPPTAAAAPRSGARTLRRALSTSCCVGELRNGQTYSQTGGSGGNADALVSVCCRRCDRCQMQ